MTTQEQDAIFGRLMREKQEMERRRIAILAESRRIGERMRSFGASSSSCDVALEGEDVPEEFDNWKKPLDRIAQSDLEEFGKVIGLAREYRATLQALRERTEQLKAFE